MSDLPQVDLHVIEIYTFTLCADISLDNISFILIQFMNCHFSNVYDAHDTSLISIVVENKHVMDYYCFVFINDSTFSDIHKTIVLNAEV